MMAQSMMFGDAEIRLSGTFIVDSEAAGSDNLLESRATTERSVFVDIDIIKSEQVFSLRASALVLVTSILALLSEIESSCKIDIAIGDGEFNIRGQFIAGLFELLLQAEYDLARWHCTRDQFALFLCNLTSAIDSALKARAISLDKLLRKFPVLA